MRRIFPLLLLVLGGCETQQGASTPASDPASGTRTLTVEQMSAFPKLACDPTAQTRKEVRARHIAVIAFPKDTPAGAKATPEELKAAYAKLERARQDLMNGEPFESVWSKYADQRTSFGKKGGDLGFFKRGAMVPEFERVAFCIPVGEISPVVRTVFGFHLIQVTEVRN